MINVSLIFSFIILFCNLYYISCNSMKNLQESYTESELKDLAGKGIFGSKGRDGYLLIKTNFGEGEKVIAYADLNNDKYTDIITYKQEKNSIYFYSYTYDHNQYIFNKSEVLFILNSTLDNPIVKNVIVNSFIKTSISPDFLISISYDDKNEYETHLFYKNKNKDEYLYKNLNINSNIVVADINGDRNMEIIFFKDNMRQIFYFGDEYSKDGTIKSFDEILSSKDKEGASNYKFLNKKFSDKYGNAFVDLNGDCLPDLILTSEEDQILYLEIYYHTEEKYNLDSYSFKIGEYGAFLIGDFDRNSQLDILFPHLNEPKVTIFYNQFQSNHNWDENYCEIIKNNNDVKEKKYKKVFNEFFLNDSKTYKTIDLIKNNSQNYTFYGSETLIRAGDFGSTGIPGLLAIFKTNETNNKNKIIKLFEFEKDKITEVDLKLDTYLEKMDIQYATFFDFAEDGRLDLIIQGKDKIISIWNNNSPDKFFIKNKIVLKKGKFSTLEFGTSFRYVVTDNEGLRSDNVVAQMPQTSGMIIPLPFAYQGIGRSNNYIEHLYAISTSFDKVSNDIISVNKDSFTPIIPNTQLIITKGYEKEKVKWEIELVVTPTENLLILLIVIIIILFIILFIIIFLHSKERNEDKEQDSDNFRAWFA